MYFSFIPDIKYDEKPIKFPFSQSEYITAKNFFRRFQVNEDFFQYSVFFNKYAVTDSDRLDTISEKFYGSPFYDWVIAISNNIINTQFDWPVKEWQLRELVENPDDVAFYETIETKDSNGNIVLQGGLKVDEVFYNAPIYRVDTTSTFLPVVNNPTQATATVSFRDSYVFSASVTNGGSGYESAPNVTVVGSGNGALVSATLSSIGTLKRIDITNPGAGYEYPPIVTLGGGLAGQSATAEITNGQVTNITLDGVKFDTTSSDQIYEFGNGTRIVQNGTGIGTSGGFNIGSTHLRFGESSGERYVILNPINATAINTVRVYAIRGNGSNGGETPDINGIEDLYIQYQVTNPGDAPDPNAWEDLGIVIDAVPNGSGTGVLDNYDFDLSGTPVQAENVYFRLYQPGNNGPQFDHYGILSVTFIGDATVPILNSTITLTTNPLQTTPPTVEATANIVLSKQVNGLVVNAGGSGYNSSTSLIFSGGNPTTPASGSVRLENILDIQMTDTGYGYETATVDLVGGFGGSGATASAIIVDRSIVAISVTNQGSNYIEPPNVVISAPDYSGNININDIFSNGQGTWKYNGTNWERLIYPPFKYNDNGVIKFVSGRVVSQPVTNLELAIRENDAKRIIYILKPIYLEKFVTEFRQQNLYSESSNFINNTLKQTG